MQVVTFDTLKLARKLESAGFPARQAQDASAALAESFSELRAELEAGTHEGAPVMAEDRIAEVILAAVGEPTGGGFAGRVNRAGAKSSVEDG